MDEDYEVWKIVLIGQFGAGKTNISTRYVRDK
jgi:GTPase SAR1 family protein